MKFLRVGPAPQPQPTLDNDNAVSPLAPDTGLPVARVRINERQVFVSGLDPSVDAARLYRHLHSKGIKPKWVVQTQSAHDSYHSFIVAVTELSFDAIFDWDYALGLWKEGTLIKEHNSRRNYTELARHPPRPPRVA